MHETNQTAKALETRILLADDQPKVRSALRVLLSLQPGLNVVGEAAEADQLLAQAATLYPDLILLDWKLADARPDPNSTGTYSHTTQDAESCLMPLLRALVPGAQVIALSGQPQARAQALACGADAFVSKMDPPDRLLQALATCQRGKQRARQVACPHLVT